MLAAHAGDVCVRKRARAAARGAPERVIVEHRNNEDTTWSTAGTFTAITAVGAASLDVTGLKEVVRLAFGFVTTTTTTDAAHLLVQAPSWRPY